jgi:hypothetical protein
MTTHVLGDTGHTDTADGDRGTGTVPAGKEPR